MLVASEGGWITRELWLRKVVYAFIFSYPYAVVGFFCESSHFKPLSAVLVLDEGVGSRASGSTHYNVPYI